MKGEFQCREARGGVCLEYDLLGSHNGLRKHSVMKCWSNENPLHQANKKIKVLLVLVHVNISGLSQLSMLQFHVSDG